MEKLISHIEKYHKIGEGQVHNIFLSDGIVYKVPKKNMSEYKDERHFLVEKVSLNILKKAGFPVVQIIKVIPASKINDFRAILIEEYIMDEQYKKNELSKKKLEALADFLHEMHTIRLRGYGPIQPNKTGHYKTWKEYIACSTRDSLAYAGKYGILGKKECKDFINKISKALDVFDYTDVGRFVILDINPMNLFFKGNKISRIIDVDHPISADPLYELGSLRMYFLRLYKVYITKYAPSKVSMGRIIFYEFVKRLNVMKWRHENNIPITYDISYIRKCADRMKSFLY